MKLIDELEHIRYSTSNIYGIIIQEGEAEFKSDFPFEDVPRKLLNREVFEVYQKPQEIGIIHIDLMILEEGEKMYGCKR